MTTQDAREALDAVADYVRAAADTSEARAAMLDACERYAAALARYNGWTNRETWTVHLWLTADPDVYDESARIARLGGAEALANVVHVAILDAIGYEGAKGRGRYPLGLVADLLLSAHAAVDWPAVAAALTE